MRRLQSIGQASFQNIIANRAYASWRRTVLSSDGAHQVPPQPPQFAWLLLHHPEAQLPPHELDHLQQLGAGGGGVGAAVGACVGACVGGVGGGACVGAGAGVGCAGPVTFASKQEMNVSGAPWQTPGPDPPAARYSAF